MSMTLTYPGVTEHQTVECGKRNDFQSTRAPFRNVVAPPNRQMRRRPVARRMALMGSLTSPVSWRGVPGFLKLRLASPGRRINVGGA